jgi:hypothetical protein
MGVKRGHLRLRIARFFKRDFFFDKSTRQGLLTNYYQCFSVALLEFMPYADGRVVDTIITRNPLVDDTTCHCYKCNSYQPVLGGVRLLDGRKRRRFVCARCRGLIKPRAPLDAAVLISPTAA